MSGKNEPKNLQNIDAPSRVSAPDKASLRKTVLVTGSSSGIGRACALAFAASGYHVFLNCRRSFDSLLSVEAEILASGGSCTRVPGDVGNPADVRRIFSKIREKTDALDVLVNNAATSWFGLLTDMSDEEWQGLISDDLSSVFYCCREAISGMVSRKSGRIINISSMWGTSGASCEVAYSAAKAGVNGLTRALAKELAPSGIAVNAIACGVTDTRMNARLNPEEVSALQEEIPAGRFASPKEIAQLVLLTAKAPVYMTGQIIGIDGGFI